MLICPRLCVLKRRGGGVHLTPKSGLLDSTLNIRSNCKPFSSCQVSLVQPRAAEADSCSLCLEPLCNGERFPGFLSRVHSILTALSGCHVLTEWPVVPQLSASELLFLLRVIYHQWLPGDCNPSQDGDIVSSSSDVDLII